MLCSRNRHSYLVGTSLPQNTRVLSMEMPIEYYVYVLELEENMQGLRWLY